MGGVDVSRDYYADLGVSADADVNEIKKQFRKLALKYHPDRNPGREAEVNSKFQIIQSAHEVLSDPQQRAKYDASRPRSRYPTASGVKGNPWQNAGAGFPPPPRRNATARNPPPPPPSSSGASRYRNFASGAAPTAKAQARDDPEAKRSAWHAFENMKGRNSQSQAKPKPEPPEPPKRPVPRTPSQRQRAEASFGRRGGYTPHSPVPGDEPPVAASNYSTASRHTNIFADNARRQGVPDPLAPFRDREAHVDSRQSTPYSSHSGEKTDPFDGVPIGRAKSNRENPRPPQESYGEHLSPGSARQRAQSVPRQAKTEPSSPRTSTSTPQDDRPNTASATATNSPKDPFRSRASARYTPPDVAEGSTKGSSQAKPASAQNTNGAAPNQTTGTPKGASMYGNSYSSAPFPAFAYPPPVFAFLNDEKTAPATWKNQAAEHPVAEATPGPSSSTFSSPSGDSPRSHSLTPFERRQGELLSRLIKRQAPELTPLGREKRQITTSAHENPVYQADERNPHSFNLPIDDDTFTRTAPQQPSFSRRSTEDITTNFVNTEGPEAFHFSAGSPVQDPSVPTRSHSGSRVGRRSPIKRPTLRHQKDFSGQATGSPSSEGKFDAQDWSQQIGAQNFVPHARQSASTSPSRVSRTNSRKVKPTAGGSAGLVNEEYDSEEEAEWRGRKTTAEPVGAKSPNAMDIDPPQTGAAPGAPANGARNIPVEPSRPEWRPGNVNGVNEAVPNLPLRTPEFNPNAAGSEDSEEFRASLADLKNVAPFAQNSPGLGSLNDLKMNLPFESQPSSRIPIEKEKAKPALEFPVIPQAPRPPPTFAVGLKPTGGAWQKYTQDFQSYVMRWEVFNAQVIEHFNARKANIADLRARKAYSFLVSRGDDEIQEYLEWMHQDKEVRRKWALACEDHEARIREFMLYKSKMN
ncbi:DnAJ-like protein [Colletotrichum chlorophyti]|uniref:DnAJ-like protein n=1 Tax=Colletotrichum chlorophyti TaxID=708187 RepID=A0A1Q8RV85_9PEZI|nr:DnAJ-like protein [Colletotrichum chlorophyti]